MILQRYYPLTGAIVGAAGFTAYVDNEIFDLYTSTNAGTLGGSVAASTVNASGAVTYAWIVVSGSGISLSPSTGATTTFTCTGPGLNRVRTYRLRVTATDAAGKIAAADVTITCQFGGARV